MERPRIRTKYIKLGGPKEKCVGYCYYHKSGLTARQLKAKKCLMKECKSLQRWEHPYWEAREEQRARRAERKERIERQYQEVIGGNTMKIIKPSVEFIGAPTYEEVLQKLERIGRVCYKSEDKITKDSAEKFIRGIIRRGHESVIEHVNLSVKVICDRGVTHEIVRHRLASYSQESTRYCNYTGEKFGGEIAVVDIKTGFNYDLSNGNDARKYLIWIDAMKSAERFYMEMVEAGASPQEARSVLPNSLKTEIVMTMNLREWRHFLRLRGGPAAHPQMQEVAAMVHTVFREKYPLFVEDIEKEDKN